MLTRYPAEERFDIENGGLPGKSRISLTGRVLQYDAEIFKEKTVAQGRFHANICGDPGENKVANAAAVQHAVERGIVKAAVARFFQNYITDSGRSLSTSW